MREKLKHIFAHALMNLVRAGWGGLASIATIGTSFLIIGIFLLLVLQLNALVAKWREQFRLSVFLEDRITQTQLEILEKRIQNEAAVKSIAFTSKEEALANFRRELKDQESLLEGLGDNPLPASFQLKIREGYQSPDALRRLSAFLTRLEGVDRAHLQCGVHHEGARHHHRFNPYARLGPDRFEHHPTCGLCQGGGDRDHEACRRY
jgi:cell division transport system permease protein